MILSIDKSIIGYKNLIFLIILLFIFLFWSKFIILLVEVSNLSNIPKVFANKIKPNISNNSSFSYDKLEDRGLSRDEKHIREKIDSIFKSEGNIYRIDCHIKFKNYEDDYTLIGKTSNNLVTKSKNLIKISDIYDIDLAKKR